ncbi:MAG: hypothetical protein WBC22_12900, partial [Sedimentisphaerales bacterium]
ASLRLTRTVFTRPKRSLPTYQVGQCNLRLINDLRSTKVYVRKNKLFLQNKANFQKVKLNVNEVLTKDYVQMDTWSIRKNEPKTNPNEPKTNPIKANIMLKRSQFKPKQTQFQSQYNAEFED